MSAAEFTPVLRARIIDIFGDKNKKVDLASFSKLTRKELFKLAPDTKDIRKRFQSKGSHESSLTVEGMQNLTTKLIGLFKEDIVKNQVTEFFNDPNFFENFVGYLKTLDPNLLEEYGSGAYSIRNIPEKNLREYFINYIDAATTFSQDTKKLIRDNVESGHLAGVWFLKLKLALGVRTTASSYINASYRDFTVSLDGLDTANNPSARMGLQHIDTLLKAVLDADYITSNLVTNSEVFAEATKKVLGDNPVLTTELQFTYDNKAAGDLLQQSGKRLNELIKSAALGSTTGFDQAFTELIKSLKPLADVLLAKAEELKAPLDTNGLYTAIKGNAQALKNLAEDLIKTPGSPSYKTAIGMNIANVMKTGKTLPEITSDIKIAPIIGKIPEKLDISQVVKEFKKAAAGIKTELNKKRNKSGIVKAIPVVTTNLVNLQSLINSLLAKTIKENMGTGNRRDILNLRTGRFAESVKVERLSQSREGMITAFYSYMRNPYGTFSDGGRQESPKTRNPKLLIAKSIREIAETQVKNRLRAVLV